MKVLEDNKLKFQITKNKFQISANIKLSKPIEKLQLKEFV